jgi:hypothetical protein
MERIIQSGVCRDINLIKREAKLVLYCQERRFHRMAELTIALGIKRDARGWSLLSRRHHDSRNLCDYPSASKAGRVQSAKYFRILYALLNNS